MSMPIEPERRQFLWYFLYLCWDRPNYLYLARQLEKAPDEETRDNLLRAIAAHAPVAWAHINLPEEYHFAEEKIKDVLGILLPKSAT